MRSSIRLVCVLVLLLGSAVTWASERGSAPYLATSDGSDVPLPLTFTAVDVTIAGVIADVRVKQTYENRGSETIDVVYVFPGSDRAAIHALTMRVGDREIRANIRSKQKAREEFEQAREEGKTASLLEQLDPSIFRMSLANVLPGDKIEVELQYTELLVPTKGEYEFFFPSTIGERYARAGDQTVETSTSRAAEVIDYAFDLQVRIEGALPLGEVTSLSHAVDVERPSARQALVFVGEASQQDAAGKDYLLRFRYQGGDIETGVLTYPEGDGGYFLMLAEPPRRVTPERIAPREFIFVVDVSGSMHGKPLDISKDMLQDLISSMRPNELFNVIQFAGGSVMLSDKGSLPANFDNVTRARSFIDKTEAGGGTELIDALDKAYALPHTPGFARSVVVVTDGAIWAGGEAYRVIRSHLEAANVFVFGIGPHVNRDVIRLIARAGMGEPFIVDKLGKGREVAQRLREYIDRPLLTDIGLRHDASVVRDLEPQQLPDLLAERPLVVVGRYRGQGPHDITIEGDSAGKAYQQTLTLRPGTEAGRMSALRQLWARERIQRLLDEQLGVSLRGENVDHSQDIEQLGLEFSLLTPYTSFVAVDQRVRAQGDSRRVVQPAPASGYGYAEPVTLSMTLPAVAQAPAQPVSAVSDVRELGDRSFRLLDGVWTDRAFSTQVVLRVRLGSPAWEALLALDPGLAKYAELGERFLLAFSTHAILISPEGFSDYPDEVLAKAVGLPRG